jgi:hypothetical protein
VAPRIAAASEKVPDSVAATHEQAAIEVLPAWAVPVALLAEPAEVVVAAVVAVAAVAGR